MSAREFVSADTYPASMAQDPEMLALMTRQWVTAAAAAGFGPAGTPQPRPTDPEPAALSDEDDQLLQLLGDMPQVVMAGPVVALTVLPPFVPSRDTVETGARALYERNPQQPTMPWLELFPYVRNRFANLVVEVFHHAADVLILDVLRYLREHRIDHELPPELLDRVLERLGPRVDARKVRSQ